MKFKLLTPQIHKVYHTHNFTIHEFYHLKPQKVTIITKALKPTSLNCEKRDYPPYLYSSTLQFLASIFLLVTNPELSLSSSSLLFKISFLSLTLS